jgi:dCMP deaminase
MRITFEELAINIAKCASERSEDQHRKVGCCVMNEEGRILSIGYNGLKPKQKTLMSFWKNREERRKYVVHAEMNALACINKYDEPFLLACTLLPCASCAKVIVSIGIKKIVYIDEYELDSSSKDIFKFYKIKLKKFN